jgi:hypothetical protein
MEGESFLFGFAVLYYVVYCFPSDKEQIMSLRKRGGGRHSQSHPGTMGGLLQRFRQLAGLSIRDMSQKTGYSEGHLREVEGYRAPVKPKLQRLYEQITGFRITSPFGKKGGLQNNPPGKKKR